MSAAAIIAIAIAAVVVLAALAFVTLARRSDVRGAGALSARDPPPRPVAARDATGRRRRRPRADAPEAEAEPAWSPATAPTLDARREPAPSRRGSPPDPEAHRRQPAAVLQPRHRHADERRPRRVRRRRLRRLPVADGHGRLRQQGRRRQARRHQGTASAPAAASSTPRRPARGSPSTRPTRCPRPRAVYPDNDPVRHASSGIVALYQKCPHLGCRVPQCVTQPVVRVPVPRLAVQPGRREEGRPGAARHGPLPAHRRRQRRRHVDTGTSSPGPPIGTNTTGQEAEGPHCITGGGRALMDDARAGWRRRRSRGSSSRSSWSAGSSTPSLNDAARRARRSARRSSWPPTASRTTTTRCSRAGASSASSCRRAAARRHRHRPAAVLGARARPPGRRDRGHREARSSTGARRCSQPTADGGFNCAGCHGGMKASGGAAPVHRHRPGHR